jgi:glutamate--cysteine ligase
MPERGALTRHMMRATAGFQLTYDVADRVDAGRKMALLYRLSPVLMALTANSRQIAGADSGYASFRHHVWLHTDRDRAGVPPGVLRAETAIDGYIAFARRARMLFFDRAGVVVEAPELPLEELVVRGEVTGADLDLHLSSLFPHVRIRNYLEVRCFDSVDWPRARAVLALVSGLVYCDVAFQSAWEVSEPFLVDAPRALDDLHEDAARRGLDALSPAGDSLRDVAGELLRIARATIGGPNCDWARPEDLDAVAALLTRPA